MDHCEFFLMAYIGTIKDPLKTYEVYAYHCRSFVDQSECMNTFTTDFDVQVEAMIKCHKCESRVFMIITLSACLFIATQFVLF